MKSLKFKKIIVIFVLIEASLLLGEEIVLKESIDSIEDLKFKKYHVVTDSKYNEYDFNSDGIKDLLFRVAKKQEYIRNGASSDAIYAVYFGKKGGGYKNVMASKPFLVPKNIQDATTYSNFGSKNVFKLTYQILDGKHTLIISYTIKYKNGKFVLIGYDRFKRDGDKRVQLSVNLKTKKMKTTNSYGDYGDEKEEPIWTKFNSEKLYFWEDIDPLNFSFQNLSSKPIASNKFPKNMISFQDLEKDLNYRVLKVASGYLNHDKFKDFVAIIQEKNITNLKDVKSKNGTDILDLNPRVLLVYFGSIGGTYKQRLVSYEFIPKRDKPDMGEPLSFLNINQKGILSIGFNFWQNSQDMVASHEYKFRYKKDNFYLVGYDKQELKQSSGDLKSYSVNFSTKKMQIITTNINTPDKKEEVWKKIKQEPTLNSIENPLILLEGVKYE